MAIQPWGGRHANLLYWLWPQRTHQFTGGIAPRLCEVVLPMPRCSVRAHLGVRTNLQALVATTCSTARHTIDRARQKLIRRTTAGIVPACWIAAAGLSSQPPHFAQSQRTKFRFWAHLIIAAEPCIGMPAQQAYKPLAQPKLMPRFQRGETRAAAGCTTTSHPKILAAPAERARDRCQ